MLASEIENKADLKRFIEQLLPTLGITPVHLPFANLKFGSGSLEYAASAISTEAVITHSLGRKPTAIALGSLDPAINLGYGSVTKTTFNVVGEQINGEAATGNSFFTWIAVC